MSEIEELLKEKAKLEKQIKELQNKLKYDICGLARIAHVRGTYGDEMVWKISIKRQHIGTHTVTNPSDWASVITAKTKREAVDHIQAVIDSLEQLRNSIKE